MKRWTASVHLVIHLLASMVIMTFFSYEYHLWYKGPGKMARSRFDIVLNGPLTEHNLDVLKNDARISSVTGTLDVVPLAIAAKNQKMPLARVNFLTNLGDEVKSTWIGDGTLTTISTPVSDGAYVGWVVAKRLNLKPGDQFRLEFKVADQTLYLERHVIGLFAPTAYADSSVITTLSESDKNDFLAGRNERYSTFFIKTTEAKQIMDDLKSRYDQRHYQMLSRTELRDELSRRFWGQLSFWRVGLVLLTYLALTLYHFVSIKAVAPSAVALGSFLAISALGTCLAYQLLEKGWNIFVFDKAVLTMSGLAITMFALGLLAGVSRISNRLGVIRRKAL